MKALRSFSVSFLDSSVSAAIAATNSVLFIVKTLLEIMYVLHSIDTYTTEKAHLSTKTEKACLH
jgi:hypothetical protein